jgi:hypothetical protein
MNGMFSCSLDKNSGGRKSLNAVTALTRNGHTMTRCCGNLEAHFQRHYNGNHPGEQCYKNTLFFVIDAAEFSSWQAFSF